MGYKDLHVNQFLTNMSVEFHNKMFVADFLAPRVRVLKASDKYAIWDKEAMRHYQTIRADKSESVVFEQGFTSATYSTDSYAIKGMVSPKERANSDQPLNPEIKLMRNLQRVLDLDREVRVSTLVTTSGNYGTGHTITLGAAGTAPWDDFGNVDSDPLRDIALAVSTIWDSTQLIADSICIPFPTAQKLARHPKLLELIKYTNPSLLTQSGLPSQITTGFGATNLNVYIAGGAKVNTKRGQTVTMTSLYSDNVIVYYKGSQPTLDDAAFCVSFEWQGALVRQWQEAAKSGSDVFELEEQGLDEKVISNVCGYLIANTLQ